MVSLAVSLVVCLCRGVASVVWLVAGRPQSPRAGQAARPAGRHHRPSGRQHHAVEGRPRRRPGSLPGRAGVRHLDVSRPRAGCRVARRLHRQHAALLRPAPRRPAAVWLLCGLDAGGRGGRGGRSGGGRAGGGRAGGVRPRRPASRPGAQPAEDGSAGLEAALPAPPPHPQRHQTGDRRPAPPPDRRLRGGEPPTDCGASHVSSADGDSSEAHREQSGPLATRTRLYSVRRLCVQRAHSRLVDTTNERQGDSHF